MSQNAVMFPVIGALVGAGEMLGPGEQWHAVNAVQKRFLQEVFPLGEVEIGRIPEMEHLASWSAAELNDFLAQKGFSIKLEPFAKGEFGVASVLDLLVEWLHEGERVSLKRYSSRIQQDHAAVRFGKATAEVMFDASRTFDSPEVVGIKTKSGDAVYAVMTSVSSLVGVDLFAAVRQVMKVGLRPYAKNEGAVIPMVDMNIEDDLSWLLKMQATDVDGRLWEISQAKQQTKLRLNEKGARAQSAAATGMRTLSMPRPPLVIDSPFVLWVMRPGIELPLFVSHITPEHWKEPADLETP